MRVGSQVASSGKAIRITRRKRSVSTKGMTPRKMVVKDVSFATIFKGVIPFVLTDLVRLVILIAFPILALWLPTRM